MVIMNVKRLILATRMELYDVVNPEGEDLGQVQNFMIDPETGRIAFVVVAFGGFLGLTDKWIAIPLEVLRWDTERGYFIMDVPRSTLERAPGIDKDKWPEEFDLSWMEEVYTCFGCRPYWVAGTRWVLRGAAGSAETLIVSAAWLKGHHVENKNGEDIGKIYDLVIDLQSGYMTYAAVELTGYEEIKGRKIAVPIEAFTIESDGEAVYLELERENMEKAPEYNPEGIRADQDSVGAIYAHYGFSPYWENRKVWRRRGVPVHPSELTAYYQPDLYSVSDLMGDPVRDFQGNEAGKLEDLMIDFESGFLASAIMSAGGFLGMGDKFYPLPLEVLSFDPVNRTFYLAVDKETIEEAPAFEKERLPKIDRQGLIEVYAAYGYTPYWRQMDVGVPGRQWKQPETESS